VAAADDCRRLGVAKGPGMSLWPATVELEGVGGSDMSESKMGDGGPCGGCEAGSHARRDRSHLRATQFQSQRPVNLIPHTN
jgi:hypothetical protein